MSVRESIAARPAIALGVIAAAVLAAIVYAVHVMGPGKPQSAVATKAFFTTDDGATLFEDDASKIPPFDHDGRQAVSAMVYSRDGGQHRWVQCLQKYSDDARQQMEGSHQLSGNIPLQMRGRGGLLVKTPGSETWTSDSDIVKFQEICMPKPPDGMGDGPPQLLQP